MNVEQIKGFLDKKVAGVKVLYVVFALVLVLGVYAWRTWRTDTISEGSTAGGTGATEGDGSIDESGALSALTTAGTVYVATPETGLDVSGDTGAIDSAQDWISKGVAWLIESGKASGTAAQTALAAYIANRDISYQQGQLVDAVISKYGVPPEGGGSGSVASAPAKSASSAVTKVTAAYEGREGDGVHVTIYTAPQVSSSSTAVWYTNSTGETKRSSANFTVSNGRGKIVLRPSQTVTYTFVVNGVKSNTVKVGGYGG